MRSRGARRGLTIVVVLVLVSILLAGVFLLPDNSPETVSSTQSTTGTIPPSLTTAKPVATTTAPPDPVPDESVLRQTILKRGSEVRSVRESYSIYQIMPMGDFDKEEVETETLEGQVLIDYYPQTGNQYQLVVDDTGNRLAFMQYDGKDYVSKGDQAEFTPYDEEQGIYPAVKFEELVSLIGSNEFKFIEPEGADPIVFTYEGTDPETYAILNSALNLGFDENVSPDMLNQFITLKFDRYRFDLFEAEINLTATAEHDPFELNTSLNLLRSIICGVVQA